MRVLLAAGASTDATDSNGLTPLHLAASGAHAACFLELQTAIAAVEARAEAEAAAAKAAAAEAGEGSGGEEEAGSGEEGEDEDPEERLLREMGEIKDRWVKVRRAGCAVAVRWVACAWHELPCCDKLVARALMDAHCSLYSALTWHGLHSAN